MYSIRPTFLTALTLLACAEFQRQGFCPSLPQDAGDRTCFSLQVYDDSEKIAGPNVVRLYSKTQHWDVPQQNGHFCLLNDMKEGQFLDMSFQTERDKFSLPSLPVGRFTGTWSFYFGGKQFAKQHGLPKSAAAIRSCMVEFNDGEPGTGMVVSPCRSRSAEPKKIGAVSATQKQN